jgi:acyl-CoA thioesterase
VALSALRQWASWPEGDARKAFCYNRQESAGDKKGFKMSETFSKPIVYSQFSKLIGLRLTRINDDYSECVLEASDRLLNVNGNIHGGAIYTMVDVGMGAALHAHLAEDERLTTVEIKINYLIAVTSGTLTCQSRLLHKSRKLAVLESEVRSDGALIAKATGTFYVTKTKRD